jgi:hypothetical protein
MSIGTGTCSQSHCSETAMVWSTENTVLLLRTCMFRVLPSNGHFLHSHHLARVYMPQHIQCFMGKSYQSCTQLPSLRNLLGLAIFTLEQARANIVLSLMMMYYSFYMTNHKLLWPQYKWIPFSLSLADVCKKCKRKWIKILQTDTKTQIILSLKMKHCKAS